MSLKSKFTIFDATKNAGLEVEFLDGMPAKYDGHLDPHDEPRFIGVNLDLPQCEQVFTVARELGFCAQHRQCRSIVFDRPWKWGMLAAAPDEIRKKICQLDAESRAFLMMLFFATGDEFRAFVKRHPKKVFLLMFANHIGHFHLLKLRIKALFYKFRNTFAIA